MTRSPSRGTRRGCRASALGERCGAGAWRAHGVCADGAHCVACVACCAWLCVRACDEQAARKELRAFACCAMCGAVAARAGSECEAAVVWERAGAARRGSRGGVCACVRASGAQGRVRGMLRVAVCCALRGVVGTQDVSECDWWRACGAVGARAGSECEAAAGWGAHCAAACGAFRSCVCACEEQTARNVAVRSVASGRRSMCGARGALRAVRCSWREGRK